MGWKRCVKESEKTFLILVVWRVFWPLLWLSHYFYVNVWNLVILYIWSDSIMKSRQAGVNSPAATNLLLMFKRYIQKCCQLLRFFRSIIFNRKNLLYPTNFTNIEIRQISLKKNNDKKKPKTRQLWYICLYQTVLMYKCVIW